MFMRGSEKLIRPSLITIRESKYSKSWSKQIGCEEPEGQLEAISNEQLHLGIEGHP